LMEGQGASLRYPKATHCGPPDATLAAGSSSSETVSSRRHQVLIFLFF